MKIYLFTLPLFLFSFLARAQYTACVDSTQINIYYTCTAPYDPQCGCDGKTYRNVCAAYYWGGLINSYNPFPYGSGPCGDFDFDFVPNPIVQGSSLNGVGELSVYSKSTDFYVSVLIQFYDIYGRTWIPTGFNTTFSIPTNVVYGPVDINIDNFAQGIYYVFVTINGESQHKKILKMDRLD